MKTDPRLEEETESPDDIGAMQRLKAAITAHKLGMIDGAIAFFKQWRAEVAPPEEEEDWRGGRKRSGAGTETLGNLTPAPRGGGFRRFLIVVALLLAMGIGAMWFSYSLLSHTLDSDQIVIDDLREQLALMEKADKKNVSIQAKDQQQLAEYKKTIREYEAKLDEYEDQIAQLRQKVAPQPARRAPAAIVPYRAPSAAPPKSGKCTATGGTAAADVARCIEEFNRP